MSRIFTITFLLLSSLSNRLLSQATVPTNAFTIIMDNVYNREQNAIHSITSLDNSVRKQLTNMMVDGSWSDVGYSRKDITNWPPIEHLKRLKALANAYTNKRSSYYNNFELYTSIVNGIRYWYQENPLSKNWWHNQIDAPQHVGELLIVLRHGKILIPQTLEDSIIERMKRGEILKQTGANKLDVATHYIYRAALTKNSSLLDTAVQEAFQPISFTTEEGLQYDYSFMQHGRQLQIGSYGAVFISGEYHIASILKGTNYELKGEKLAMLSNYYINTYLRTLRGGYSDFNVEGRGVSRVDILNKHGEENLLKEAAILDPSNTATWNAAIARTIGSKAPSFQIIPSHNHFYCADYTIHTQPDYSFNVRTVSVRTKRTESGNGENLVGKFLPDGSTNIQVRGDEYYNIMPIWDWNKIPGITSREYDFDQLMETHWGEVGSTSFVGGVSDSSYGATCYSMNYNGVKANKSWFFFDKEVVCLGAGITSSAKENITTTLNQCWLKGVVEVKGADNKSIKAKSHDLVSIKSSKWLLHDGIGYYFPEGQNLLISTKEQTGSWVHINDSKPKNEIKGDVFKSWINHGVNPSDAHYAYIVVPNVRENAPVAIESAASMLKIMANNDTIQAVYNEKLAIAEAIFYQASSLSLAGLTIKCNQPCAMMLRNVNNAKKKLYISDPTQQLSEGKITIVNESTHNSKDYSFHFPSGNAKGASLLIDVE